MSALAAPSGESSGRLTRPDRPALAWQQTIGDGPTIVFLPGYASDMSGSKAQALFDWALANGHNGLLLDYAGCGASDGAFEDETLETWRDDALDVIAARAPDEPLILIGSSMGGWLMLMVALAIPHRIAALVGIAAAPDFTDWGYTDDEKAVLQNEGRLFQDNTYGPDQTLTTLALWQSGERNRLLDGTISLDCPARLLHGQADGDVPFTFALSLAVALRSADVRTLLIKDGDHRLSRPQDIALLIATVEELIARHPREGGDSSPAVTSSTSG